MRCRASLREDYGIPERRSALTVQSILFMLAIRWGYVDRQLLMTVLGRLWTWTDSIEMRESSRQTTVPDYAEDMYSDSRLKPTPCRLRKNRRGRGQRAFLFCSLRDLHFIMYMPPSFHVLIYRRTESTRLKSRVEATIYV